MGLFSKKPKELEYGTADCVNKKTRMRELFNEAVADGDTYEILHATETSSKFEKGFVFNTNTTTFYYYILGYRKNDCKIVLVQTDRELTRHSDAFFVDMDAVVNVYYNPKQIQACLIYKKGYSSYGEILTIEDIGSKTMFGIANMVQKEEREAFLDFLESVRSRLEQAGYKLDKWKRQ